MPVPVSVGDKEGTGQLSRAVGEQQGDPPGRKAEPERSPNWPKRYEAHAVCCIGIRKPAGKNDRSQSSRRRVRRRLSLQRSFPDRRAGKQEPSIPAQSLESSTPLVSGDQGNPGMRIKEVRHFPRRHAKPVLQLERRYRPESSAGFLHSQRVLQALYAPAKSVPVSREAYGCCNRNLFTGLLNAVHQLGTSGFELRGRDQHNLTISLTSREV